MEHQKTAEVTNDLIGNKIYDKVTKIFQQNNSETITNEHVQEIPKEKYISPEEIQKIIDELTLI